MLYRETQNGFEPWNGEIINNTKYPTNIEFLWSAEELAAVGLYLPVVPAIPNGKVVTGESVSWVDGTVCYVYALADLPPPPVPLSALEKLVDFLNTNPDVKELLSK